MRTKDEQLFTVIMNYIDSYTEENGCSPTVREIADATEISRSTMGRYLQDLIAGGRVMSCGRRSYVTDTERLSRRDFIRVPILGEVACGLPKFAEENIEDYVQLPASLFGSGDFYMLRANGYSMIDVGISSGDFVLIRRQNTAEPGEIVVALVEEEATLKRYFPEPERRRIRLHPENRIMDDIYVSSCEIQGIAVKVLKDL
ncbi:MAG: repressor LexA [Clostridia bacterium]|nr:repressor LexA [Clostridia bacterium]